MRNFFWHICVLFAINLNSFGQENGLAILSNENALDRPLNVHAGQIRITGEYLLTSVSKDFSRTGNVTSLSDVGLGRVRHKEILEIRYGISEHLEFISKIGYQKEVIRETSEQIIGFPNLNSYTVINSVTEASGLDNLTLGVNFRIPFNNKRVDVVPHFSFQLPLQDAKAKKPDNELIVSPQSWNVVYRYHEALSPGVSATQFGGAIKFRFSKIGVSLFANYTNYIGSSNRSLWNSRLGDGTTFINTSVEYKSDIGDLLSVQSIIEFQASPIFQIYLIGELYQSQPGWYENNDVRYKIDQNEIWSFGPGFDLIITPRIWLNESVRFPISGVDTQTGVVIQTRLIYNMFVK